MDKPKQPKTPRITEAQAFSENLGACVILQQVLNETHQLPTLERLVNLDHIATLILASQPPAQA
mgnify:CR=1 FL=1|tara:strand:+ start:734 stop:925 length:192 start_codon:yes stop_codon:yes gene_type:complete